MNIVRACPSPAALTMRQALRSAARKELDKKQRLGQYAVVWQNDEVIELEPVEIRNILDTLNGPRHA